MRAVLVVAAALLLAAAGCQKTGASLSGWHRSRAPQVREVSGRVFELEYAAPRTRMCQWRYRGIVDGCHVLDFYGIGNGEEPEHRYSIRTPLYNLPKGFPAEPQKPIKPAFTAQDDKYFEMLQEEERRDKVRTGQADIIW